MTLTEKSIDALLKRGETLHLECKTAQGGLPRSLWESYSAFCNTDGGYILLGVKEYRDEKRFEIVGVNDPTKLLQDFWNTINAKDKVNVNVLTDRNVEVIDCGGAYATDEETGDTGLT